MHLESVSEARTYRSIKEEFVELDDQEILEELTDSHTHTHTSFLYGIIISKYNTLVNQLN